MLDYPKNTVYLISPIPLIDYFDEVLKIKAIQKSPPPERPLEKKLHYPTIYNEIIEWIKKNAKNRLFLIGAGPLGKDYCYQVKNNGGIAVDLGSLFDKIAYDRNELKKYSRKFRREISDREGYLAYIPNFKKFHPL